MRERHAAGGGVADVRPTRFEDGAALRITGLRDRYEAGRTRDIPVQWERWIPQMDRAPGRIGRIDYGVCLATGEPGWFEYVCGVEVASFDGLPAAWAQVSVPAQRYAVFEHQGHVSEIAAHVQAIFGGWLPGSGLHAPGEPGAATLIERYREDFDPKRGVGGIELWAAVRA